MCSALKLTVSAHASAVYRRQHGYTWSARSLGLFPGKAHRPFLPRVYKRLGSTSEPRSSILPLYDTVADKNLCEQSLPHNTACRTGPNRLLAQGQFHKNIRYT